MKTLFTITAIVAATTFALAQAPSLPIEEGTGRVVYTEVVNVDGATADQLYNRALKWFSSFYTNPTGVIQSKDAEGKKITGKHGVNVYNEINGKKNQHGKVRYYIDIMAREGRFKVKVYEIYYVAQPKLYIEKWMDDSRADKENCYGYLNQVHTFMTDELLTKLKQTMAKPLATESDDDW